MTQKLFKKEKIPNEKILKEIAYSINIIKYKFFSI